MFRNNVLKYGGTIITYKGNRKFEYKAFYTNDNGVVDVLEMDYFFVDASALIVYGGSENNVKYISIVGPNKKTKIPFAMVEETPHRVSKIIKLLFNKANED